MQNKKNFRLSGIIFLSLFLILLSFVNVSCKRDKTIYFDSSEPHSLVPDISWALVTEPYVAFRADASWESEANGHARKEDILEVTGKSISAGVIWYKFEEGWLPDSSVQIFSNRYKALTAKEALR